MREFGTCRASAHQDRIHYTWHFRTKQQCVNKIGEVKRKYPYAFISCSPSIHELHEWENGIKGYAYYMLSIEMWAHALPALLKI